jgi:hypothetical protein
MDHRIQRRAGGRPGVGSMATHTLLLSKSSKTSTVPFLFSRYCSLVGITFLLGGEILATLAFDIHILGVKVKVKRVAVAKDRRGLRTEYIERGVRIEAERLWRCDRLIDGRGFTCWLL